MYALGKSAPRGCLSFACRFSTAMSEVEPDLISFPSLWMAQFGKH